MAAKAGATVAVLGPGAVGGMLAVRLAQAGVDVVCVATPSTAAAIASEGLSLRQGGGKLTTRPRAVTGLDEPADLLVIAVKAPALEDALDRVTGSLVLPILNGLEHMDLIRARLAGRVAAGSVARFEAYRESATRIVQTTPGAVLTVSSREAAELLEPTGIDLRVVAHERTVLWEKLARLAPLAAATAATQRPVGELRSDPEWRSRLEDALSEACAVAAADGVDLTPREEWEIIGAMPHELTTSTARDVAAGRPSELDAITGAVVRAGLRLGIPTPTLAGLLSEAEDRCQARSR